MLDFIQVNPCQVYFGDAFLAKAGELAKKYGGRSLLITGGASARTSGALAAVVASLAKEGIVYAEHSGVRSNPDLAHARAGIVLAKEFKPDCVIAVGGGSVIDEAKAIAFGALADDDVWTYFTSGRKPDNALPLITVPTLFGSGSETNPGAVLGNAATNEKLGISGWSLIPRAALISPSASLSAPPALVSAAFADAFSHTLEGYFNGEAASELQDAMAEAVFKSLMNLSRSVLAHPQDMAARSDAIWATCIANSGQLNIGRGRVNYELHTVAHVVGAILDLHHPHAIAVSMVPWLRLRAQKHEQKLLRFGGHVLGLAALGADGVEQAIAGIAQWLASLGVPTSLSAALGAERSPSLPQLQKQLAAALGNIPRLPLGDEQVSFLIQAMQNPPSAPVSPI